MRRESREAVGGGGGGRLRNCSLIKYLYNKLFSPDRRGCPPYCDTDATPASKKIPSYEQASCGTGSNQSVLPLVTLVDGFPGVEPVGLPTERFFFMIVPEQNEKRYNRFFNAKNAETARVFLAGTSHIWRRRRKMIDKIPSLQQRITG